MYNPPAVVQRRFDLQRDLQRTHHGVRLGIQEEHLGFFVGAVLNGRLKLGIVDSVSVAAEDPTE